MKITFSHNDLLNAINISLRAIPAKTNMTILECIVIKANSNNIKFISNNMEIGIETIVNGIVVEEGNIAVPAKFFSEVVRKLPDSDVTITTDSNYTINISCESIEFNFQGRSDEEFPALPSVEKQEPLVISQFTLKEVINQTVFAVSDNESNKIMTGEYLEIEEDNLKIVALDGHRIAVRNIKLAAPYKDTKVIVPGKTLIEITKILTGEKEKNVNIFFTQNHILFEFENTIVLSRLIEGEYYRINQMISGDFSTKVKINKRQMQEAVDRSTLLIKETDKKPLIINITDYNMSFKAISQNGTMGQPVNVEKEGNDIQIGFNPRYILDILRVIDDEEVTLFLNNSQAPGFFKNEEDTYLYLLLPINFAR